MRGDAGERSTHAVFAGARLRRYRRKQSTFGRRFEYDPDKWSGASLKTVLTAVIDRRLRAVRRREIRYRRHLEAALEMMQARYDTADEPQEPYYEELKELVADVRAAVAGRGEQDRAICVALSEGCSLAEVAVRLSCDWRTVHRRVASIRAHFEQIGLNG